MHRHLYLSKKPCANKNNLELTDYIRKYVLEYKIYHPKTRNQPHSVLPKPSNGESYIYLIQDSQYRGTNVYKLGRTTQKDDCRVIKRMKDYNYGSEPKFIRTTTNVITVESDLKRTFKQYFQLVRGQEWFKGDLNLMIELVNKRIDTECTVVDSEQLTEAPDITESLSHLSP